MKLSGIFWFGILSWFMVLTSNVYALQKVELKDDESGTAKISANDLTRIFVDGDRIQSIRGLEGTYIVKNDNLNGQIYIKPTPEYQQRPFDLFLTTESGRTYTLLLIPLGTPAENIEIKPKGGSSKQAEHWETGVPYEETLTNLMTAMLNVAVPEGFEVNNIAKAKKLYLGNIATLELKTVYLGKHLRGEIYRITNRKTTPINLTETEFYRLNTRALTLKESVVNGKQSTFLYAIVGN